ncbi:MAG: hypothetical protein IJM30_01100 [Thermoguttaceae bacterium]|nr:hypothetical protein [Thermoguttaceae bacterium]
MDETLFHVSCSTCETVFEVADPSLIGQIVACPKCGGMMLVEAPESAPPRADEKIPPRPEPPRPAPPSPAPIRTERPIVPEPPKPPIPPSPETPPAPAPEPLIPDLEPNPEREATTFEIWRSRVILMLLGIVCALVLVLAGQTLIPSSSSGEGGASPKPEATEPEPEPAPEVASEAIPEGEDGEAAPGEGLDEELSDEDGDALDADASEELTFERGEVDSSNENFDPDADLELEGDAETDETVEDSDSEPLDETETDEPRADDAEIGGPEDESEEIGDVPDDLDEPDDAIAIETDASEDEGETESSDDEEEEDLGAVASTTDASLQAFLPALKREPKKIAVAERLQLKLKSVTFPESPASAVRLLAEFSGAPIDFDLSQFELLRPSLNANLDLSLEDATVESALSEMAKLFKWDVDVQEDRVVLSPRAASAPPVEERFDVSDLLELDLGSELIKFGDESNEPSDSGSILARLATTLVEPESWEANGGTGSLRIEDGALVVTNGAKAREQIAELLDRLRAPRGLETRGDVASTALVAENLGWKRLSKKISFNLLEPIKLQQAIEILERTQKLRFLWDDAALNEYGVGRDSTTLARIDDATLDRVLFDLLEPLKLTCVVLDDNLFLVATTERAESLKTLEVHMFSAQGKVDKTSALELAEEATSAVAPKTWSDPANALWIDLETGLWLARQSRPTQLALRRWLDAR